MSKNIKNVNVNWYGNLNKLIGLGVILSIPIIIVGIYLWSRYLAARIIVWVFAGLIGIGLLAIVIRWVIKVTGIRINKKYHHPHREHHNYHKNYKPNKYHKHKHH